MLLSVPLNKKPLLVKGLVQNWLILPKPYRPVLVLYKLEEGMTSGNVYRPLVETICHSLTISPPIMGE